MPEGPEVQTVLNVLEQEIRGAEIREVEVRHPKLAANLPVAEFEQALRGQRIEGFSRIGKYLVLITTDYDWIIHLRMEGKFYVLPAKPDPAAKHMHALFELADGRCLVYHDVRKFGRMYLYPRQEDLRTLPVFAKVGPDAFSPVTVPEFRQRLKKNRAIKLNLLDQDVIAGIGNIYADEILFASRIHPQTPAKDLTDAQLADVLHNTREILAEAVRKKGTTIRSYTSSLGVQGEFQNQLRVHTKDGSSCPVCGHEIEKTKVGQRTTYFCPVCQKLPGNETRDESRSGTSQQVSARQPAEEN